MCMCTLGKCVRSSMGPILETKLCIWEANIGLGVGFGIGILEVVSFVVI